MLRQCDQPTLCEEPHPSVGRAARAASTFRITAVEVRETRVVIRIDDGAPVEWPLRRLATVARAHPQARQRWELTPDGTGVNWPALSAPQPYGMVSVWEILQEQLFDDALARGFEVGWDLDRISVRDAQLVALWRLTMDLVFGGYLQFRCSWDAATVRIAREALAEVGAASMAELLGAMDALADHHGAPRDVGDVAYVPALMSGSGNDRLQDLEVAFWEQAIDLPRQIVERHFDASRPRRPRSRPSVVLTGSAPRTAAS